MKFDLPKDQASIIKVIGVGGGGSNAVNHMYNQGITGVDFVICNTDAQALELSPIPNKIQLGTTLTEGLGAGANPEVGKNAAIEDIENIKSILEKNTKMVFITAGMGGGTGTGAAPVIAQVAREMGILTVGIVTIPFSFEGRKRKNQADLGMIELRNHVDTLLVINNDKLRMLYGNLRMGEAFSKADDILTIAAKGIAEIITVAGYINVDFEDVKTVMKEGGTAIMGSAEAEGESRAIDAVVKALSSPLLNDNEIKGANYILLNITSGEEEITMDEIDEITDYIQNEAGYTAELIWGNGTDETLGDKVSVTVIATGFGVTDADSFEFGKKPEKIVHDLTQEVPTNITQVIDETTANTFTETPIINQPAIEFDKAAADVVDEKEEDKIVFSLEDTENDIEDKRDKSTDEAVTSIPKITDLDDLTTENTPEEPVVWNLNDDVVDEPQNTKKEAPNEALNTPNKAVYTNKISDEDQLKKSHERIMRIKELGMKMKTPSGINDLEKEPAYKRRNVNLNDVPHSSENPISRFNLTDDENGRPKLNDDNSFLHDNVD